MAAPLRLQVMQQATLQILDAEDPGEWMRTMVLDFNPERDILLSLPSESGGQIEILPGTHVCVKVSFVDGVRRFTATVLSREATFGGAIRLTWPEDTVRIQRRDYVRVTMTLPVEVEFQPEDAEEPRLLKALTIDLSAGGVRLNLPEPVPAETEIGLEVRPDKRPAYRLRGRVVHAGELEESGETKRYWAAVQFLDVSETLRNDIIQYVFDVQREQIRRSLA